MNTSNLSTQQDQESKTLGQLLRQAREIGGYTLRQVEEATGISNGYLSQLETGKIKKPSANVLYKLAQMYCIELETLLGSCGLISGMSSKVAHILTPISKTVTDLTKDEERELVEYLHFLRFRKNKNKNI